MSRLKYRAIKMDNNLEFINDILEINDVTINLSDWYNTRVLFIVGISGSGKSYLSKQIKNRINCEIIELDDFRENQRNSTIDIIDLFNKEYPDSKEIMNRLDNDELFEKWFEVFLSFLEEFISRDKRLFIIEGIQIFHVPFRDFFNKSIIIKGTHPLKSYNRQKERGSLILNDINTLKIQEKLLNEFQEKISNKMYKR